MKVFGYIKVFFKKRNEFKIEFICQHEWFGSQYGGFYVSHNYIKKNSVVYSFGIGEDISFDIDLINKTNCKVYGFDPTPKSINWLKKQTLPDSFHFDEYGVDSVTGNTAFFLPKNKKHVSGSLHLQKHVSKLEKIIVAMKSFEDIINEKQHDRIDLLKIDIEGSEYDIIDSILSSNVIIPQIVIEVHHRFFKNGKQRNEQLLNKLKLNGYLLFAYSKRGEELSFINPKLALLRKN
jgi:FkbM family methyltransferase